MGQTVEIERKFLISGQGWQQGKRQEIAQGYISQQNDRVVRVRQKGDKAFLTIKADQGGISRLEFEYEIPVADCATMLNSLCGDPISKTRYTFDFAGMTWEVDQFHGVNDGLILAEIELNHPDQAFEKPDWLGPEVSTDPRFFNAYIADNPFSTWGVTYASLLASSTST